MAAAALPLDERLARYIVEGSKEGLIDDLGLKLEEAGALQIINGPLMRGMEEVGRLFNDNQLIVAEVLQSAEAMKAAVAHLEGFMAKDESSARGTMVLATVKGDVHDIGKNLVEIILKNNGYRIINLGIKVPPEDLIAAYHLHKPDAFGLSGLLVKSAQQMVVTAQDLRAAGIEIPLFVGGAALTRKFTATRIAAEYPGPTLYAKDAMDGLDIANRLFSATTRDALLEQVRGEQEALRGGADVGQVAGAGPGRGGGRAVVGLARRRRARAAGPRPARAAQCAAEPCLPLPESADAPRQAPRREGVGRAAARAGRRQGRGDHAGRRGAQARGGGAGLDPRRRPLPVLRGAVLRRCPDAVRRRRRGRALSLPASAGR